MKWSEGSFFLPGDHEWREGGGGFSSHGAKPQTLRQYIADFFPRSLYGSVASCPLQTESSYGLE